MVGPSHGLRSRELRPPSAAGRISLRAVLASMAAGEGAWIAAARCEAATLNFADLRATRGLRRGGRFDRWRSCAVALGLDRPVVEAERVANALAVRCVWDAGRSAGALQVSLQRWHAHVAGLDRGIWAEVRLCLDPAPQRLGPTLFPCLRHSSRDKRAGPRRSPLRFAPSGAGPIAPGPGRSHQGRDGRGLGEPQRRAVMAIIGTFTQNGNGLTGSVKTLTSW